MVHRGFNITYIQAKDSYDLNGMAPEDVLVDRLGEVYNEINDDSNWIFLKHSSNIPTDVYFDGEGHAAGIYTIMRHECKDLRGRGREIPTYIVRFVTKTEEKLQEIVDHFNLPYDADKVVRPKEA